MSKLVSESDIVNPSLIPLNRNQQLKQLDRPVIKYGRTLQLPKYLIGKQWVP